MNPSKYKFEEKKGYKVISDDNLEKCIESLFYLTKKIFNTNWRILSLIDTKFELDEFNSK